MQNDQIVMGAGIALLCLAGLWNDRWFLAHTKKGRWLVRRCGETGALWTLRSLLTLGTLFGVLLAVDVIRPVQW